MQKTGIGANISFQHKAFFSLIPFLLVEFQGFCCKKNWGFLIYASLDKNSIKGERIDGSEKIVQMASFWEKIILLNVPWYLRYTLSYRDLEKMILEWGVKVDHAAVALAYTVSITKMLEMAKKGDLKKNIKPPLSRRSPCMTKRGETSIPAREFTNKNKK
jgi:hypothetical protein